MANYTTSTSDKNKSTAAILCAVGFLGIAGLHLFYVGRIGKGLLYFCTMGLFLIGTIADLIKISTGGFRDNVGAPLRTSHKPTRAAAPVAAPARPAPARPAPAPVPSPMVEAPPVRQEAARSVPVVSPHKAELPTLNGYDMKYSYSDVKIAGGQYYSAPAMQIGTKVELVSEKDNPHDPRAVAVMLSGQKLGYLYKGKLQDMYHDFSARGDLILARVSQVGEGGALLALGFYVEAESEYKKLARSGAKSKRFKLTGNTNEEMQYNLGLCGEGDEVSFGYDYEKERYEAICGGDIGFFPKSANDMLENCAGAFVEEVEENDNGKYAVRVIV